MEIKRIEHMAINTIHFNKAVNFYRDIMGFQQLETIENGDSEITYFMLPDGARLELFDYGGKNDAPGKCDSSAGLRHLAFEVADVAAHENELRAKGVNITFPTTELKHLGVRVLLFQDPDGVTIEFCEKL